MISIRLGVPADNAGAEPSGVLVCLVLPGDDATTPVASPPGQIAAEIAAFLAETAHSGKAGELETLPRPLRQPSKLLLVGVGLGDEAGWRAAGAAIARGGAREAELAILVPADLGNPALRGLSEGIWLGDYAYRLRDAKPAEARLLERVTVLADANPDRVKILTAARVVTGQTNFARDLTNTPSIIKTPAWFVERAIEKAPAGVTVGVREPAQLAEEGFGGILAVGGGSAKGPRLLEMSWRPEGATEHIVMVGKGITYDTGGIDIKPVEFMQLMRKDMGGAATVLGATLAAAELNLRVRITALLPLAENMISGSAWRSGDVIRHYGGLTSEVHSTDAEGRVVLADAMAYAVAHLEPDVLLDLATLTGASRVALGFKTAALFSESTELVDSLTAAATAAGEQMWRLPLADDYAKDVAAEIADLNNAAGNPGAITAALYLREFAGALHDRWVHIDMSAPSWSAAIDGELPKGATGWGVRTLVRWLSDRSS